MGQGAGGKPPFYGKLLSLNSLTCSTTAYFGLSAASHELSGSANNRVTD